MTPLFDRLLVREAPLPEVTTEAGLLIGTTDLEQAHDRYEVVSVGGDVKHAAAGDFIWAVKKSGSPILVETEKLFLMREAQIDLKE